MGTTPTARTFVTATMMAALLAAACSGGGGASVATSEDVVDAIAATFSGSFTATQAFDLDISRETLQALAELDSELQPEDQVTLDQMADGLDAFLEASRTNRSTFQKAEDGSFRFSSSSGDVTVTDFRADLRELVAFDTLTPAVRVLLRIDVDEYLAAFQTGFPLAMTGMSEENFPSADDLRAEADKILPPGPLGDVARAVLDGEFGGIVGTLDLEALGATQEDLDEFAVEWEQVREVIGADVYRRLFTAAVGINEISDQDGRTVVSVDIRPRDAVRAGIDLLREVEPTVLELDPSTEPLPQDLEGAFEDATGIAVDDLPESIEDVAELWFDGDGHLTHIEVDLIQAADRVIAVLPEPPSMADEVLAELADATAVLRTDLSDFGTVDTVMDVEATTIEWDDLTDLFGMFQAGASG